VGLWLHEVVARLTALELKNSGMPVTVITDNSAGYFTTEQGKIDALIVLELIASPSGT
jgi:methylthioribose-1-phosphate isomerase